MLDTYPQEFDSIRPYTDAEIPAAMQRIAQSPYLAKAAEYVFPTLTLDQVRNLLNGITTIDQFQHQVMLNTVEAIVDKTIESFTFSGLENINPEKAYLFVSNHRDIVLDAMLLQPILDRNGFGSCQITFGANLMQNPLVVEIGKSNKMFRVERGGNLRQFYASMTHTSAYMRYAIEQRHESVWIAQRNGRTKDGRDTTEASLIKMFARSGKGNDIENLASLNICPLSISYEWEPCDQLKAIELSRTIDGVYHKAPNEDLNSILTGIMQSKGHVHLSINKPIDIDDLSAYQTTDGDIYRWVAELMDKRIYEGYQLMPTNYIAHDLLSGSNAYCAHYTQAQMSAYKTRISEFRKHLLYTDRAEQILLGIYANPVDNQQIKKVPLP